jgi:DNA-binding NarL/FixJ family response regulator
MPKDIRVVLVEDDPYARDLMALLLTRDWRTRVVGEADGPQNLQEIWADSVGHIDLVILDTEIPDRPKVPTELAEMVLDVADPPVILYTATTVNENLLRTLVNSPGFGGYVLKSEVRYALASAVALAWEGNWVITPGVCAYADRLPSQHKTLVLDGQRIFDRFTQRESELIRLGIIFNLSIRDMADELVLTPGWVSEVVSKVYQKLGLREILSGEEALNTYFQNDAVLARCEAILKRPTGRRPGGRLRKAPWMATLAFHLLTVPRIYEM